MPIEFACENCSALVRTPDGTAGKRGKCPECGTIMQIPLPGPAPRSDRAIMAGTIEFPCVGCHQLVRVPAIPAGKKGKCPHCRTINIIPTAASRAQPIEPAKTGAAKESAAPREAAEESVEFPCTRCGEVVLAPAAAAGKKGMCPHCRSAVDIPRQSGGRDRAPSHSPLQAAPSRPKTPGTRPAASASAGTGAAQRIEFPCPSCAKLLRVAPSAAGREARCPHCEQVIAVPAVRTTGGAAAAKDRARPAGQRAELPPLDNAELDNAELDNAELDNAELTVLDDRSLSPAAPALTPLGPAGLTPLDPPALIPAASADLTPLATPGLTPIATAPLTPISTPGLTPLGSSGLTPIGAPASRQAAGGPLVPQGAGTARPPSDEMLDDLEPLDDLTPLEDDDPALAADDEIDDGRDLIPLPDLPASLDATAGTQANPFHWASGGHEARDVGARRTIGPVPAVVETALHRLASAMIGVAIASAIIWIIVGIVRLNNASQYGHSGLPGALVLIPGIGSTLFMLFGARWIRQRRNYRLVLVSLGVCLLQPFLGAIPAILGLLVLRRPVVRDVFD